MPCNMGKTHPFTLQHMCVYLVVRYIKWVNTKFLPVFPQCSYWDAQLATITLKYIFSLEKHSVVVSDTKGGAEVRWNLLFCIWWVIVFSKHNKINKANPLPVSQWQLRTGRRNKKLPPSCEPAGIWAGRQEELNLPSIHPQKQPADLEEHRLRW